MYTDESNRGGMKESGIGRENGLEAFDACRLHCCLPLTVVLIYPQTRKANLQSLTLLVWKRQGSRVIGLEIPVVRSVMVRQYSL